MLAAEAAGARTATLIPDPYHVPLPGLPVFAQGLLPPRSALGRGAWSAAWPLAERARRHMRGMQNELRGRLGLPPLERLDGAISEGLAMVATFPQLEYPRDWPPTVHVTGPMLFDLPGPRVEPPPGDEPLVVVVASTTGLEPASRVRRDRARGARGGAGQGGGDDQPAGRAVARGGSRQRDGRRLARPRDGDAGRRRRRLPRRPRHRRRRAQRGRARAGLPGRGEYRRRPGSG